MKKLYIVLISLFTLFSCMEVNASSASISVSSNKSSAIVGDTITVTVTVSSSANLGSWQFDVSPSTNLQYVSSSYGGMTVVDNATSASVTSKSYTFVFKSISSGTGTVTVRNANIIGWDESSFSSSVGTASISMQTQSELEATYSTNNYLSNLTVDGYSISPSFNKDTLEYSILVENDVTEVIVSGVVDDSTAKVSGVGTLSVSEGVNSFEIIVTAQNGSIKKYKLNVTVKELSPINVTVDGVDYTVIRQEDGMPSVSLYYQSTYVNIEGEDVPGFTNSTVGYTLVGLKDNSGVSKLFIYDNGVYTLYNEINFDQIGIIPLDFLEPIDGFEPVEIMIGNVTVTAYKKDLVTLVYGKNLSTGATNIYSYDASENTLQKYLFTGDADLTSFAIGSSSDKNDLYFYIIIGLSSVLLLTYLVIIIKLIKNNKLKKYELENTMSLKLPDKNIYDVASATETVTSHTLAVPLASIQEVLKEENIDLTKELTVAPDAYNISDDDNNNSSKLTWAEKKILKQEEKIKKQEEKLLREGMSMDQEDLGQTMIDIGKINKD